MRSSPEFTVAWKAQGNICRGQYIYLYTVCFTVDSSTHLPVDVLERLLGPRLKWFGPGLRREGEYIGKVLGANPGRGWNLRGVQDTLRALPLSKELFCCGLSHFKMLFSALLLLNTR